MSSDRDRPQAADPGEVNQRRRLEALSDAQERAEEFLFYADSGAAPDDVDNPARAAHAAVKAYATRLQWAMINHGDDKYRRAKLGAVTVPPPEPFRKLRDGEGPIQYEEDGVTREIQRFRSPPDFEAATTPVHGLLRSDAPGAAFLELPSSMSHTFEAKVDVKGVGPVDLSYTVSTAVPVEVSSMAFQLCNQFVDEHGLSIRLDAGRARGTYID